MRTRTAFLLVAVVVFLFTLSSVLVTDSPYDPNVTSEQQPFAPDKPGTIDGTTAPAYLVTYEEIRFRNDIRRSRGYTLDRRDEVRTNCTESSVTRLDDGQFRVELRCRGSVVDVYRLVQPPTQTYEVTYRITEDEVEELDIDGYPFAQRDRFRPRPASAT